MSILISRIEAASGGSSRRRRRPVRYRRAHGSRTSDGRNYQYSSVCRSRPDGNVVAKVSHTKWARYTVTRQKASALAIGNTQALRGHLSVETPVDNVLNYFESVNFIQSEKLRCVSRHQNLTMVNLRDGHLNLSPMRTLQLCC